ncbi:Desert hedgehog protein [Seminavis robusta]|uniref:Desert hedgehog protein n=1 Tax=Seminavis robusta TaxID=568900 RepID=A0A9N8DVE9_9STRA|nr:Desert hedgehog protein [Seminavis robusta]|eukprot:Sro400_g135170.1 Desert hedgehog protein (461) ;mRNA; r:49103-50711
MLIFLPYFCMLALLQPALGRDASEDPSFLRAMEATSITSQRRELIGNCKGDCNSDDDCNGHLICYQRDPGERVPTCCPGKNRENGKDFCVTESCAAHTDAQEDDDPYWQLDDDFFNKIKPCEPGCDKDDDCYNAYVCFKRNFGAAIPSCCASRNYPTDNDRNYCAVRTCNSSGGSLCFSGETQVHVSGGKTVSVKDLQVGDQVLTRNSQGDMIYQPVYAFAHRHQSRPTQFLGIQTTTAGDAETKDSAESPLLEMSREHMVYVQGKAKPIRADTIQVGDILQGISSKQQHVVTEISPAASEGLYAPLTRSGTIVVSNGIVASNYIAMQEKQTNDAGYVNLPGIGPLSFLHQADVAHMWLSPFRIFCGELEVCQSFNADGFLHYASWGLRLVHFMEQQSLWAQILVLIPMLIVLSFFATLEHVLDMAGSSPTIVILLLVSAALVWLGFRRQIRNLSLLGKR